MPNFKYTLGTPVLHVSGRSKEREAGTEMEISRWAVEKATQELDMVVSQRSPSCIVSTASMKEKLEKVAVIPHNFQLTGHWH